MTKLWNFPNARMPSFSFKFPTKLLWKLYAIRWKHKPAECTAECTYCITDETALKSPAWSEEIKGKMKKPKHSSTKTCYIYLCMTKAGERHYVHTALGDEIISGAHQFRENSSYTILRVYLGLSLLFFSFSHPRAISSLFGYDFTTFRVAFNYDSDEIRSPQCYRVYISPTYRPRPIAVIRPLRVALSSLCRSFNPRPLFLLHSFSFAPLFSFSFCQLTVEHTWRYYAPDTQVGNDVSCVSYTRSKAAFP